MHAQQRLVAVARCVHRVLREAAALTTFLWESDRIGGAARTLPPAEGTTFTCCLRSSASTRHLYPPPLIATPRVSQVLLQPDAPPPKVLGLKLWPTAIPQYELGHLDLIAELEKAEAQTPGLWVCGNYRSGVAFPDCVEFGYQHAKTVAKFLDGH